MSDLAVSALRRGGLRALSITLILGAVYDFLFAALILAAPRSLSQALALPLPGEPFYLRVLAVLLAMAGAVYLVAARRPGELAPLVWIAVVGRFAGFAVMAASALHRPELTGLWLPASGDLAFSLAHLATGWRLLR